MSIPMPGGTSAQLFVRYAGKEYRVAHGAPVLVSGRVDAAGRLIAQDANAGVVVFVETRTIEVPMRDGDTATYTEGGLDVHYRGVCYQWCGEEAISTNETSFGYLDDKNPSTLVIETAVGGAVELAFFYRV